MKDYADANDIQVAREFVDVETAKKSGRTSFNEMLQYVRRHPTVRTLLVEKTDRLYRNLKDWVTVDDLDIEIHFVKEGVVLSQDSRSSEKFMHGIKVLMAKNYIDNLSEETRKGMLEKAEQGLWPTVAPIGYLNVEGPNGKKIITIDPALGPLVQRLYEWYSTGQYSLKEVSKKARQAGLTYRKSGAPIGVSTFIRSCGTEFIPAPSNGWTRSIRAPTRRWFPRTFGARSRMSWMGARRPTFAPA